MSKDSLQEHYQRKYASEQTGGGCDVIPVVSAPTSRFEAVVKFFPQYFRGGDIMEVGAGNGNVAVSLMGMDLGISSYTLSDISRPRLEGLKRNVSAVGKSVNVLQMDVENIPQAEFDGRFDAVVMIALIEHLIDPLRAMQQVRKLLKAGGFVYLDTPNIAKYTQRLKLLSGRFPSTASKNEGLTTFAGEPTDLHDEGHLHYFTYRSLTLMLTQRCGFSRVVKLGYPGGRTVLGTRTHNYLAQKWPEMFSELALIAYA